MAFNVSVVWSPCLCKGKVVAYFLLCSHIVGVFAMPHDHKQFNQFCPFFSHSLMVDFQCIHTLCVHVSVCVHVCVCVCV